MKPLILKKDFLDCFIQIQSFAQIFNDPVDIQLNSIHPGLKCPSFVAKQAMDHILKRDKSTLGSVYTLMFCSYIRECGLFQCFHEIHTHTGLTRFTNRPVLNRTVQQLDQKSSPGRMLEPDDECPVVIREHRIPTIILVRIQHISTFCFQREMFVRGEKFSTS